MIWLTVVSFAVAAFLLEKVAVDESSPAEKVDGEYWRELTAGFRHLWVTPGLGRLTVALAVGFGAAGLVNAAVFPAMERGFGIEPAMIGVLISLQGVGAVIGGARSARLVGRLGERRAIAVGMAAIRIGLFPLAGTSLAAGIAGLVLIGLGVPWVIVAYSTMRQRLTPPDLQGRTAAAANMAISIPQTLTTAFAAALLGLLDYRMLVVATVAIVLVNALALRSPSGREVRLEEGA